MVQFGDPIFVASPDGDNPVKVFEAKDGVHCHFPTWSPDGRFIYFAMGIPTTEEMDIWRISVPPDGEATAPGFPRERLTSHNSRITHLDWLDSKTLIYTATGEDSSEQWLYAMDVDQRIPYRLFTAVEEQYLSVAISTKKPRRLIATKAAPISTLHTLALSDRLQTSKDVRSVDALNTLNKRVLAPRYSPVHKVAELDYLFFLSSKGGRDGLWKLENGNPSVLWEGTDGGVVAPPAISPDGRNICFSYRKHGRSGLYVMKSDGSETHPITDSLDVRGAASWSPDKKFVVVAANRKGAETRVFKVPVDGGEPVPLTERLSYDPIWLADDDFILYSEPGEGARTILKAVTSNRAELKLPQMDELSGNPGIAYRLIPGRRAIIARIENKQNKRQGFSSVDLETGKMQQLAELESGTHIRNFDIALDGKSIIFDRVENRANIWWANLPE